jgi:hypothetical protein
MKLTEAQKERMTLRVREVWKPKPCAICDTNQWAIADDLYQLLEYPDDPNWSYGSGSGFSPLLCSPLVVIFCQHCGNSHFLGAAVLGLIGEDGGWLDG